MSQAAASRIGPEPRRETCPNCGAGFACNPAGPCWCSEVTPRFAVPAAGEARCWCPDCLRRRAAEAVS